MTNPLAGHADAADPASKSDSEESPRPSARPDYSYLIMLCTIPRAQLKTPRLLIFLTSSRSSTGDWSQPLNNKYSLLHE